MFLDPVDNDDIHQSASSQTVGFDVGVLIREVRNRSFGDFGEILAVQLLDGRLLTYLDVPPCLRSTLVTHGQLAFQGGCNGSRCDAAESPIIFFTGGNQS